MYGLLGSFYTGFKDSYATGIMAKVYGNNPTKGCEVAKCLAYCINGACESQCDGLESTDEKFLDEISWTKDMCDMEASKESVKTQCESIKTSLEGCDANCGGAEAIKVFMPLLLPFLYYFA